MKTPFLSIIIASIVIGTIASIAFFFNAGHQHNPCTFCPEVPSPVTVQNNTPLQNISTVIIPKDSEDQNSGKNYEPAHLVVVLGINNTVRWINEADVGNTIVANNYDDHAFANATKPTTGGYMHLELTNFLTPGQSFNYTFTKIGRFGYHGEPHPWLDGWVSVLPPSSENATQTVVLNSTQIVGPCEIFRVPCPNNPTFTAQKFGSNVFIEKMTINGIDHYAVVNPEGICVYPDISSQSCTNPDDLAMLRLIGVDASVPEIVNTKSSNPLGITALLEFVPINMNWDSGPNYHYYLKISSNSTAYLLGYDICGKDLCVKNNTLSILLPMTKLQIPNYKQIGVSDTNHTWNYGDTVNMQLEVSPSLDNKTGYFLNFENSTIVP